MTAVAAQDPIELNSLTLLGDESAHSQAANDASPADSRASSALKVLGSFFIFVNTYGVASSYGVYQDYYQTHLLPSHSPSAISWIGTVQVFLLGFTGILAGPLYDRGHLRILLGVGSLLLVVGFLTLSVAKTYWEILLAQGICIGIGTGLIYVPGVSVIANTFRAKRSIAIGLASSGSAFGSIVFPIAFKFLAPTVGIAWVNRIFGIVIFALSVLTFIFLRSDKHLTTNRGAFFELSALKEYPFVLLCTGLFLVELGYWIPPFYITPYAQLSLQTSAGFAFYLLAIMNAGGLVGRIFPAYLAQLFGATWVLIAGALSLGILVLCWLGIHNVPGIIVWAILVGFMSGITVSFPNAVVPHLSPSRSVIGARTGMMWSLVSVAALIGSPISGALVNTRTNNYAYGEVFSGASICLGAAILCAPAIHIAKHSKKDN